MTQYSYLYMLMRNRTPWCRKNYTSHDAPDPEGSETRHSRVIAYRPEAGNLVLFPILQGKNGRRLYQTRFQDSQSFAILNQRTFKSTLTGVGHPQGYLRGLLDPLFLLSGLTTGSKEGEMECGRGSGCSRPTSAWAGREASERRYSVLTRLEDGATATAR